VKRRALIGVLLSAALGCHRISPGSGALRRVVSLSPGITDALFEIGAGADVIARSDYCDYPPEVTRLPRVGTSLTPNYEAITRLSPTLIVGEQGANAREHELEAIGPTLLLPWLTLDEIVAGVRELGRRTNAEATASALATRMKARLDVPAPANGPRVLLVIGYEPGRLEELWFIRENSLHGAALHAAGARNAVPEAVTGLPRLSLERLLGIDPDAIFILTQPGHAAGDYLAPFRALAPLRAVKLDHVSVVEAAEAYVHGPCILALVDKLAAEVNKLRVPG
jgi:ABC-type Fe3+-hydroxamate transport system substrate-binding protein